MLDSSCSVDLQYQWANNPSKPTHIFVEGAGCHGLSVLNDTPGKSVDIIYIDRLYNTGNKDFRSNDLHVDRDDSYRHSKWLSFMSKRLRLAGNLLKDDGLIFILIGDDASFQFKMLCNDRFLESSETQSWFRGLRRTAKNGLW